MPIIDTGFAIIPLTQDTWTCHICGDTRPDRLISVNSHGISLGGGVIFTMNVRHCNDRQDCIEKAKSHSFFTDVRLE